MIPFNDLSRALKPIRKDIERAIANVLDSGMFASGSWVEDFEDKWAEYTGQNYCIAFANGTDALAGMAQSMTSTSVTIPAHTIPNTLIGLRDRGGANVVILDKGLDFDVQHGLYGKFPRRIGYVDACQLHGWKPQGHVCAWSFYPTKNLGAVGEGGAVTTDDASVSHAARAWRDRNTSRMREIEAASICIKLPHLDRWNAQRKELAGVYWEECRLRPIVHPNDGNHHLMAVMCGGTLHREYVMARLAKAAIGHKVHYPIPLNVWDEGERARGRCPLAEAHCSSVLSLPIFPGMTKEEVRTVCDVVNTCAG